MNYTLDDSLGFMIYLADLKMRNLLQRKIKEYDITAEQWALLNRLCAQDGFNQRELAQKSFKDQASLTRILDRMEKKGYIRREASPNDRRAFLIFITKEGRQKRDELIPFDREVLTQAESIFSQEEIKQFKYLLRKLVGSLD